MSQLFSKVPDGQEYKGEGEVLLAARAGARDERELKVLRIRFKSRAMAASDASDAAPSDAAAAP